MKITPKRLMFDLRSNCFGSATAAEIQKHILPYCLWLALILILSLTINANMFCQWGCKVAKTVSWNIVLETGFWVSKNRVMMNIMRTTASFLDMRNALKKIEDPGQLKGSSLCHKFASRTQENCLLWKEVKRQRLLIILLLFHYTHHDNPL